MKGVEALSASIRNAEEYVDVLVNNAGIGTGAYIDDLKVEDWDRTLDLNLRSPLFLTQSLLVSYASAQPWRPSSVIFISTVAASEVFPHVMAYSTSKKGLEHLTPQLALALADDHIRVNAIAPGRFYSEMTRGHGRTLNRRHLRLNWRGYRRIVMVALKTLPAWRLCCAVVPERISRGKC